VFYVALENQDDVSSAWLVRGLDGKQYKPQGYITAFTAFVKANESQIEAIRILLSRPQSWSTEALTELYRTLAAAPQRFTMENLQKAHQLTCNKALADIISMVKHAANEQSPLLTAAERVDAAIAKVTADKTFTPEQQQWLQRIRAHLQENLTIDKDDFDTLPVFSRFGGWGRAKAVFGSQLPVFIKQINEAVAA
jgi:type I restriction enzyme R subunit